MRRWQQHGKSLENNSVRKMKNPWSGMPKERCNWPRILRIIVTIQNPLSREVFWHENAKIPRQARQNPIAAGDFQWILTRNCEDTEQLRIIQESTKWLTFYNKRTGIFGDIKSFVGLFLYKCPKVAVSVNDVSILVAMTG